MYDDDKVMFIDINKIIKEILEEKENERKTGRKKDLVVDLQQMQN